MKIQGLKFRSLRLASTLLQQATCRYPSFAGRVLRFTSVQENAHENTEHPKCSSAWAYIMPSPHHQSHMCTHVEHVYSNQGPRLWSYQIDSPIIQYTVHQNYKETLCTITKSCKNVVGSNITYGSNIKETPLLRLGTQQNRKPRACPRKWDNTHLSLAICQFLNRSPGGSSENHTPTLYSNFPK